MSNQKKSIAELLEEAKALKLQEQELKAKMKAQKHAIASEYTDGLDEATKQMQIKEAESILNTAKDKAQKLKNDFKAAMKKVKADVSLAKEILSFVNYKQTHSLPKVKNQFSINGNMLTFRREGLKDITIDISKDNWQKTFKAELAKQGINGDDRIADNIVYKASKLVESEAVTVS